MHDHLLHFQQLLCLAAIEQFADTNNPFPIPKFRSATEVNLACKILIDTDRKYMVQTLATVLMTHIPKPSLQHCSEVAKSLVTAHPFLKDEEGDGEVRLV